MYGSPELIDIMFGPRTAAGELPERDRAELRLEVERVLENVYDFEAEEHRIHTNPELTSKGKDLARERALEKHLPPLKAAEAEVARLEDHVAAIRERAVAGFTTMSENPNARPRDVLHFMEEQEIRTREFDRLSRGNIYALYLEAMQTGKRQALIDAIHRSPVPVFNPPLTETEIEMVERGAIDRSVLRDALIFQKTRLSVLQWAVGRARQRLGAPADIVV